jgi:predicted transcriptional regulator
MVPTHPRGLGRPAPELKAQLQKLAEKQNRSLTNYVETLLRQHVEAERKRK